MQGNAAMDVESTRILAYKLFTRAWSAYCKTLVREVLANGKTIVCPVLGIFSPAKNLLVNNGASDATADAKQPTQVKVQEISYMPSKLLA